MTNNAPTKSQQSGFSMLELLIVVAVFLILGTISVMGYQTAVNYLRVAGDLRNMNGLVAQAKMEAASGFTRSRVYADLAANSFHLEVWNKALGCWQTVGDSVVRCTAATSPVTALAVGNTFGFAGVGTPPANTQTAIGQAPQCYAGSSVPPVGAGAATANTACIVFNSRGIPVTTAAGANQGNPDGTGAFYLTNGSSVYGLTVSASGLIQDWSTTAHSSNAWMHQ